MPRASLVVGSVLMLALSCGGDGSRAKDWSDASLLERAVDFCVKRAACTDYVDDEGKPVSIATCLEEAHELLAYSSPPPTRRQLGDLADLRDCYNRAKSCKAVRACAGAPTEDDAEECDPVLFASSCATRLGVSTLRTCQRDPDGEGGTILETDCTKFGLVCGFDADNTNRCVSETCAPSTFEAACTDGGDLRVCGDITKPASQRGSLVYEFACGELGLGCLAYPNEAGADDDILLCTGQGDECDPFTEVPTCDGTTLTMCLAVYDENGEVDGGNQASWDCAAGAIHHTCAADLGACATSTADCDPAIDVGSCDGDKLFVCVDGTIAEIDCAEHGLSDCQPGQPALCVE